MVSIVNMIKILVKYKVIRKRFKEGI